MKIKSTFVFGIRNIANYYLARLSEHLWFKPLITCLLSVFGAIIAGLIDHWEFSKAFPDISFKSIRELLSIMSTNMLVIAVFAVGAMVSAYSAASNTATPRSFPLVLRDDVSQNALSTFLGAFIFSIVAFFALLNGFYDRAGRFVLFAITIFVFSVVILSFVRWVDQIARLGRIGNTIDKVEAATDAALKLRAQSPTLGAKKASSIDPGIAVFPASVGYVQNINIAKLQQLAEQFEGSISVRVLPGTFVTPVKPLALVSKQEILDEEAHNQSITEAFVIAADRTYESDPRFGLVVLSEIASRALSPAVNDPGTAIKIIGTYVRLFVRWAEASERDSHPSVHYDRVAAPALSVNDLFDDAFNAISRDGAALLEVGIRLQKALHTLSQLGHEPMRQAALSHAEHAFDLAKQNLQSAAELETLRSVSEKNLQQPVEDDQYRSLKN